MKSTMNLLISVLSVATLTNCQELFHSDLLEVSDAAPETFLKGPVVRATANIVNIDDTSVPNEYYGPLFIGSAMKAVNVSYDTMSDWTMVSSTAYDISGSNTKSEWKSPKNVPTTREFKIGDYTTRGPIYNESMCLIHSAGSADRTSARLCVNQMPFVYAPIDFGEESKSQLQGVLGLARGGHN